MTATPINHVHFEYNAPVMEVSPISLQIAFGQAQKAAARGAEAMDAYNTGWYLEVDPDRLEMRDSTCCILGQSYLNANPKAEQFQRDASYTTELHDFVLWLLAPECNIHFPNPVADRWENIDMVDMDKVAVHYGFDIPENWWTIDDQRAVTRLWDALTQAWREQINARLSNFDPTDAEIG